MGACTHEASTVENGEPPTMRLLVRASPVTGGAPGGAASLWRASQTRHRRTRAPQDLVPTTGQAGLRKSRHVRGAPGFPIARETHKGPRKPLAPRRSISPFGE